MNRYLAMLLPVAAAYLLPAGAVAEDNESYAYATYHYCDLTKQERADELVNKLDKPIYDKAVDDGTITSWSWMSHHTGGKWRRLQVHTASSIDALLAAQKKIGDQIDAKSKSMSDEESKICYAHDDYIWHVVAGNVVNAARGKAAFSVYYECDSRREDQADALIKQVFAPMYDKLVAEGKITSWGWLEHIVGGKYRRLSTITAPDVTSLLAARGAIIASGDDDPLAETLNDICPSHADYIWETKASKP